MGRLVVDSSYHPMGFGFALIGPKVTINGHPVKVPWGQAPFDLPAGNYHVHVAASRVIGDFGPAELPVTIHPGQLVTLYYRPPVMVGMKGSLGFQPARTRGMGAVVAVLVVFALAVLVLVIAVLTF